MLRRYFAMTLMGLIGSLGSAVQAQKLGIGVDAVTPKPDLSASVVADIFAQLQKRKIKRLAICPRVISRDKAGENAAFVGDLGPLAESYATNLREAISRFNEDGDYQIQIVPDAAIRAALRGVRASELYDDAVLSKVRTRADALLLLYDRTPEAGFAKDVQIQAEMNDIRQEGQTDEAVNRSFTTALSLSDAAYAGRSFVVRKIGDDKVQPVGLRPARDVPQEAAFGVGLDWERIQYAQLQEGDRHPLHDASNPFAFQIVVGGQPREIWFDPQSGNKAYVGLDLEEEFEVRLNNHSSKPVLQALLIDGVNSISMKPDVRQERQHPLQTDFSRHWFIKPAKTHYSIEGYLQYWRGKVGKAASKSTHFKVTQTIDADPTKAEIDSRNGLLTVIVYALRNDGYVEYTEGLPATFSVNSRGGPRGFKFGIGPDQQTERTTQGQAGERGLMLSAMTVHYVESRRLKELKNAK